MAAFSEAEKKQFLKLQELIEKENKAEWQAFEESTAEFGWDKNKEIDRILLQILFLSKKQNSNPAI